MYAYAAYAACFASETRPLDSVADRRTVTLRLNRPMRRSLVPSFARPTPLLSSDNMEVFRPAYGDKGVAGVSMRVMNYACFLNTKYLFKYMRYDAQLKDPDQHLPVTVHARFACPRTRTHARPPARLTRTYATLCTHTHTHTHTHART